MNDLARRIANLPPEKRAELLRRLEQKGRTNETRPPAPGREPASSLPLSFAQQRLWFLDQLEPGQRRSTTCRVALRLDGPLDVAALERAPRRDRAPPRGRCAPRFAGVDGQPVQVIAAGADVPAAAGSTCRACPRSEREARLRALARDRGARGPSTWRAGRCCAARLLRLGEQEHVLLLTMHHIVATAGRWACCVRELAALYARSVAGPAVAAAGAAGPVRRLRRLAARAGSQGEVLERAARLLARAARRRAAARWSCPPTGPRPAVQTSAARACTVRVCRRGSSEAARAARRARGRDALHGAARRLPGAAARALPGQDDLAVGTPIAGPRPRARSRG